MDNRRLVLFLLKSIGLGGVVSAIIAWLTYVEEDEAEEPV